MQIGAVVVQSNAVALFDFVSENRVVDFTAKWRHLVL